MGVHPFCSLTLGRLLVLTIALTVATIGAAAAQDAAQEAAQDDNAKPSVPAPAIKVSFVVSSKGCSESLLEIAELFEREEKPEFWQAYEVQHLDATSPEGQALLKEHQSRAPVFLIADAEGQLMAASRSVTNVARLGRWLVELSRGEGTVADLRKRIDADGTETGALTEALYHLATMQSASRRLGKARESYRAIEAADPERATPGGEALHHRMTFGRFFQSAGRQKPEEVDLGPTAELARSAKSRWVRCTSSMNLAAFAGKLDRLKETRGHLLAAWKDCPETWRPEIALQIRRAKGWPAADTVEEESPHKETWNKIASTAAAAEVKYLGRKDETAR